MMTGFEQYRKKTRRAVILEEMEQVVPWREWCAGRAAFPKPGSGRPPVGGGANVAVLLFAAMVQPVGPGRRRGAVRLRCDAAVHGH